MNMFAIMQSTHYDHERDNEYTHEDKCVKN